MKENDQVEINRAEIRKEFQLERMTLFSDAVFAIVMTLMAIEIRLPEHADNSSNELFLENMRHIAPVIIAYAASFAYIGSMWYSHLQIFSLLKDYDKGLVIRNLVFLFFLGLFPFSVTLMVNMHGNMQIPFAIYLGVILVCRVAQFFLQDYILNRRPELRIDVNVDEERETLKKTKISLLAMVILFPVMIITGFLIENPDHKPLAVYWLFLLPLYFTFVKSRSRFVSFFQLT